jgi:chemotaxis protein CheD
VTDLATIAATEVVVRIGEVAASGTAGDVLLCVGLGSCVGLALVSRRVRACALAHVMLPEADGRPTDSPAKYADHAVPALITRLRWLGAYPASLEAVVVGGAQMFPASVGMDIGARNEAAVRAALDTAGVPVTAAATAGSVGRTIRVDVATGTVTVREAGSQEVPLR